MGEQVASDVLDLPGCLTEVSADIQNEWQDPGSQIRLGIEKDTI